MVLVIIPLTALMEDQIKSCESFGLNAGRLDDFSVENRDILFTSPEMLERFYFKLSLLYNQATVVVVDEFHCVVNWCVLYCHCNLLNQESL